METALDIDDDVAIKQFMALAQLDDTIRNTHTYRLLRLDDKKDGAVE
jgi:hypothetical protein